MFPVSLAIVWLRGCFAICYNLLLQMYLSFRPAFLRRYYSYYLGRLYIGSRPEMPGARFRILTGTINDEKVAEHHLSRALCNHILLTRIHEIYLRLLDR